MKIRRRPPSGLSASIFGISGHETLGDAARSAQEAPWIIHVIAMSARTASARCQTHWSDTGQILVKISEMPISAMTVSVTTTWVIGDSHIAVSGIGRLHAMTVSVISVTKSAAISAAISVIISSAISGIISGVAFVILSLMGRT